jgi:hypothetical protein
MNQRRYVVLMAFPRFREIRPKGRAQRIRTVRSLRDNVNSSRGDMIVMKRAAPRASLPDPHIPLWMRGTAAENAINTLRWPI